MNILLSIKVLLSVAIFFATVGSNHGLRILGVFPLPMNSMNVMTEALMTGLATRGHKVDVYSHFPPKKVIPNFNHFNLLGTVSAITNNLTYDEVVSPSIAETLKYWIQAFGHEQCNLLGHPHFQKLINNPPKDPPYDLFVTELSVAICFLPLGRHLNVPIIFIENSMMTPWHYEPFGTPVNPAVDTTLFRPFVPPMSFFQRLDNFYHLYLTASTFNRYTKEQDEFVTKYFGPNYPSVVDLQKDVALVLLNYDPVLFGVRTFAPIVVPVSGLHVIDSDEKLSPLVQKWLDESKNGFIYVSFGSMIRIETFPKHVLDAFYKTFENIAPVRVLMKIAKPELLPPGLPSNVITQTWLPQIQVLKHKNIKVFVTHGGLMGTTEAIYHGVPMIGVPVFFDQEFNLDSYVKNKIALKLNHDQISEDSFTRALKEIISDPIYKNNVIRIKDQSKDRPLSPVDTAVFWMEYVHRYGKNSLRSPVVDIPWWQANQIDIYGFIIGLVLINIFIVSIIISKFINLFCKKTRDSSNLKVKKN